MMIVVAWNWMRVVIAWMRVITRNIMDVVGKSLGSKKTDTGDNWKKKKFHKKNKKNKKVFTRLYFFLLYFFNYNYLHLL